MVENLTAIARGKDKKRVPAIMSRLRNSILARLKELGLNKNDLVRACNGTPSSFATYSFLRGDTPISSESLVKILDVLDWNGEICWDSKGEDEGDES